jgi:hypothetical protein
VICARAAASDDSAATTAPKRHIVLPRENVIIT